MLLFCQFCRKWQKAVCPSTAQPASLSGQPCPIESRPWYIIPEGLSAGTRSSNATLCVKCPRVLVWAEQSTARGDQQ